MANVHADRNCADCSRKRASPEGARRSDVLSQKRTTRIGRIKRNAPKKHSDRPLTRATPRLRRRVFILSCRDRRPRWQKRPAACDRSVRWRKRWMMKPASTAVPAPGPLRKPRSSISILHSSLSFPPASPAARCGPMPFRPGRSPGRPAPVPPDSSGEARFSAAERTASAARARRRQRFSISAAATGRRW